MILSILVYVITAALMWVLCENVIKKERKALSQNPRFNTASFRYPELWWCIFVFTFIVGARYNTGVDHLSYLESYDLLSRGFVSRDEMEPGFLGIERLFVGLNLHYFFWFAFWGFIQIFFIMYSQRAHKEVLPYICAMIMLGPYFMTWMNGIRQCVVICIFVCLLEITENRSFKKLVLWVLVILICSTIHKSAIFLLPLFFVGLLSVLNRGPLVNFIILAVCIVVGLTPNFYDLFAPLQYIFSDSDDFSRYSHDLERLMMDEETRTVSFGPARLANLAVSCFIIWYYPKIKSFFNYKLLDHYFILFLLGTWLYNLLVNTSFIFLRPVMYLTVFQLPLFGYCMVYLKKSQKNIAFSALAVIAFTQAIIAAMKYGLTGGGTDLSESFLYHFFFFQ